MSFGDLHNREEDKEVEQALLSPKKSDDAHNNGSPQFEEEKVEESKRGRKVGKSGRKGRKIAVSASKKKKKAATRQRKSKTVVE